MYGDFLEILFEKELITREYYDHELKHSDDNHHIMEII